MFNSSNLNIVIDYLTKKYVTYSGNNSLRISFHNHLNRDNPFGEDKLTVSIESKGSTYYQTMTMTEKEDNNKLKFLDETVKYLVDNLLETIKEKKVIFFL